MTTHPEIYRKEVAQSQPIQFGFSGMQNHYANVAMQSCHSLAIGAFQQLLPHILPLPDLRATHLNLCAGLICRELADASALAGKL